MTGVLILLVLVAFIAAPFAAERLRQPLDDAGRADAPGHMAALDAGATYYQWHGPVGGPVAVLIHGLSTPSDILDPLAARLADDGFRVLTYDLPGRGLSDDVPGPQTRAFFLRQLNDLLADQGVDRICLLVGYSMGGSIATCLAAESPERVARLVLLATAGLYHSPEAWSGFAQRTPLLGDWLMIVAGGLLMRRVLPGRGDLARIQRAQTRRRGFMPAVLSSLRHILAENLGPEHRRIQAAGIATLALWGEEDRVIPISNVGRLAEVNRNAIQETVPGATHALPYTHSAQVMQEIRRFLSDA